MEQRPGHRWHVGGTGRNDVFSSQRSIQCVNCSHILALCEVRLLVVMVTVMITAPSYLNWSMTMDQGDCLFLFRLFVLYASLPCIHRGGVYKV